EDVPREVNRQFVGLFAGSHYRTIDNEPAQSPLAHVVQLPAGHIVWASIDSMSEPLRYWALTPIELGRAAEDELAEQYRALIDQAVRRRWAIASRPAFTLSGGLDSSTVLASAAHISGAPCEAFSGVYLDPTYDERNEIADMLEAGLVYWHPIE